MCHGVGNFFNCLENIIYRGNEQYLNVTFHFKIVLGMQRCLVSHATTSSYEKLFFLGAER